MTSARQIRDLARREFGHDSLLSGQSEAIGALANGEDVLLVSPTGAGKSLVYQVGGLLRDGCTIVVSPLLALQQDQVERIDAAPPVRDDVGYRTLSLDVVETEGLLDRAEH